MSGVFVLAETEDVLIEFSTHPELVRGVCNDDARVDIADGVFLIRHLFADGTKPGCELACDASGDGDLNGTDAIYLFNYRFLEGPQPVPPFPDCGFPDELDLSCEDQDSCDP